MARQNLSAIPADIRNWAEQLFGPTDIEATQQSGGANNRVYLWQAPKNPVILKLYGKAAEGLPDRFVAETEFLQYANTVAHGYVPDFLDNDQNLRVVAMEFLDGPKFEVNDGPKLADIRRAAEFLSFLNDDMDLARQSVSSPAAEGYLSLSQHAENIQGRVDSLGHRHLPSKFQNEAKVLISKVKKAWQVAGEKLNTSLSEGDVADSLSKEFCCISPSDFGFHNAVATSKGTQFYDFEFAGWDDPTKAIVDFFLQPRIRVPQQHFSILQDAVASSIPIDILLPRAKVLNLILQVKWTTIVLAVLRPERLEAMMNVRVDRSPEELIRERLERANTLLSEGYSLGLS